MLPKLYMYIVNLSLINAEEITIKYFEAGHTFMSVGSFHYLVEKLIFDINDFTDAFFSKWKSLQSFKNVSTSVVYPADLSVIKVNRNSLFVFST